MEVAFDTDPKKGVETRIKLMDMLRRSGSPRSSTTCRGPASAI